MALYETSALITAPLEFVFAAWSRHEEFPRFMAAVKEAKETGPGTSRWRVEVGGRQAEWTAEIVRWMPNQAIQWRSTSGQPCAGTVSFYAGGRDFKGTRIAVLIEYNPPGWLLGDLLDSLSFEKVFRGAVLEALAAFKQECERQFGATPEAAEFLAPPARRARAAAP